VATETKGKKMAAISEQLEESGRGRYHIKNQDRKMLSQKKKEEMGVRGLERGRQKGERKQARHVA